MTSRLTIKNSVISTQIDGETLVLSVDTGVYFGLEGVGAVVWAGLERGWDDNQIVDAILQEYEANRAEVQVDVQEFLQSLLARGLIGEASV